MKISSTFRSLFFLFALFGASSASKLWAGQPDPGGSARPVLPGPAPVRDPKQFPQGYYSGDPLPPRTVYLTFDDGPSDFTQAILDILAEEKVSATFFLNAYDKDNKGAQDLQKNLLSGYAGLLRRMVESGHVIGHHTYSHRDLAVLTPSQIRFQITLLSRQLVEALGSDAPGVFLFRPPFGSPYYGTWNRAEQRLKVSAELEHQFLVMLWTLGWDSSDGEDWVKGEWYNDKSPRYSPGTTEYRAKMERMLARILSRARDDKSGIVLLHDSHPVSRDILRSLIGELKSRGYSFGTLNDYCFWRWGPDVFERFKKGAAGPSTAP